jgi:hypothetical protein
MDASLLGLPIQSFHQFTGSAATMKVKVASAVTVVDASGPSLDEAETVTLFNDLCVFAPGALVDRNVVWSELDPLTVGAAFTLAGRTIRATLKFNERGELIDFVSDDRSVASKDGRSFTKMRWSTPLKSYRDFGGRRVMGSGEGIWHAPAGAYAYLRFELDAIEYNVDEDTDLRRRKS